VNLVGSARLASRGIVTGDRSSVDDAHVSAVLHWWTAGARQLPWRQTRDVYAVWVSEVMLIQTQVERVEPAWRAWMDRWPTVTQLAAASLADVLGQWQGLGYPRRARDLHRSARIVARCGWPDDLTALPGVGAYVDAAVRCFALEQPVLPVDVNVRRVLRRRFPGGVDSTGDPWRTGQALMEFGQRICTARPRCGECPVNDGCVGVDADPERASPRASRRFEGSLRQRRGQLLHQVIADGAVPADAADPEAAAGLAADGLVLVADGWLLPPS
jgi:A/G-specific adenine glycosylase